MQSTERFVFDINCNNDPMPIKGYSVFGFTADADRNHSTILGDQIMLKTILNTNIPIGYSDSLNLRLPIGSVQIKQEEINIIKSLQNELIFQLEKWEVIAKEEWSFDINEESIILPEVLINSTQGFSATVTDLRIRPDALREGNVSVDGGLNLGGIAPLILTDGLEPIFNYDAGIGHYRISLVGETGLNNAAYVEYLPNTQTKLEFSSVGLLSNDESALVVDKNMRFFDIIDIDINMITSGNGYFSLSGRPTLDFIPGLIPDGATMTFTKENNQLKSRLERLQGSIECYHNVEFVLDQQNPDLDPLNPDIQNIKDGEYTIYGDFIVSPSSNEGAGDPFKLRGLLTKTNDHINIDVINVDNQSHPIRSGSLVQHLKLGNKKLNVFEGNINVINQAWDSLRFKAHPNANDMVGLSEDNVLEFTVNGNVSANSKEIKVSEIDTPFGEAKFAFDFTEPSLSGSIRIEVPVSVGFATLNQGMIKMRFDPKGFYILADANMLIAPSPVPVRGGLVIGNTSRNLNSELYPLLAGFRTNKPNFSSGLEGFYAIGQRSLNLGHFNVGIITAALDMGAGTYLFCNFAENFKFTVGGYGYLEAHGGISDPCEIGLYMDANANMEGGYDNGWWYSSCNKIGARISLCIGSETFLVHGKMSNRGSSWGHGNCPANK